MNYLEAEKVIRRWWAYLDSEKEKTKTLQALAVLARTEPDEARKRLRQLDNQPKVYDGSKLFEATKVLIKELKNGTL